MASAWCSAPSLRSLRDSWLDSAAAQAGYEAGGMHQHEPCVLALVCMHDHRTPWVTWGAANRRQPTATWLAGSQTGTEASSMQTKHK